jgi:hypothetical protein
LLVVGRLAEPTSVVYITLKPAESASLFAQHVRELLSYISQATKPLETAPLDASGLGVTLAKHAVPYRRSDGISPREALFRLLRTAWDHKRDLAAIVKYAGGLVRGGSG